MLEKIPDGLFFCRENENLYVQPYGENVIRVRATPGSRLEEQNWTLPDARPCRVTVELTPEKGVLNNGKITAEVDREGHLTFRRTDGAELLKERWTLERDLPGRTFRGKAGGLFHIETQFLPNENEHFYGMGQEAHDLFDLKGAVIDLCQQNTKSTIPYLVSSRGYGFLWNNPGIGRLELGASATRWVAEGSRQLDYLVFAGDSIAEVVEAYSAVTGYAPEFPAWAAGLWQSKLRYETQEELLEVAREYKRRGIPISMIVCDYFHWPQQGEWKFDPQYWPAPAAMVRELEQMGVRLLVSIWPTVDPRSENYDEMRERNMLIRTERGPGVVFICRGPETYYDSTNPAAGAYVFEKVRSNYMAYGVKNFWLDEAEPELTPYDYDNLRFYLGNGVEVANLYPYYYAKNFYDGLRRAGQDEVLNLIRCAFIGSQRFGVVLWSGDIMPDFASLRRQIKTGLHVSLCGIPWWTTDIGGFHGGRADEPEYRECMIRWFQFGAFCPVFRMHGFRFKADRPKASPYDINGFCYSGGGNEIWSFGEEAYGIMKRYVMLRERLRPYIMQQMHLASQKGTPVMRPLFYDFPQEPCYAIYDQYLFGPALMACPIHDLGVRERKVYLPAGCDWIDVRTKQEYAGGQTVTAQAPLEWMPLFLKKDSGLDLRVFVEY